MLGLFYEYSAIRPDTDSETIDYSVNKISFGTAQIHNLLKIPMPFRIFV